MNLTAESNILVCYQCDLFSNSQFVYSLHSWSLHVTGWDPIESLNHSHGLDLDSREQKQRSGKGNIVLLDQLNKYSYNFDFRDEEVDRM